MDAMVEEQLDYGDEDFAGNPKLQNGGVGGGAIPALAEDEMIDDDDDEFDGLYNDVNVGEHFTNHHQENPNLKPLKPNPNPNTAAAPFGGSNNGSLLQAQLPDPKIEPPANTCMPGFKAPPQNPNVGNNFDFSSSRVPEYAMTQIPAAKVSPATVVPRPAVGPVDVNGPTVLFVGDLHWWTTDADLESVVTQYGRLKEIKFFDERASGKSKGYCQVEFYDASAAAACKEGMDGYEFNGRACVVAFASPQTLRQMGASYANQGQGQLQQQQQGRRQMNDGTGRGGGGGDGGGRNFGRGGWGSRGGQGMVNRGQGGGMRGRGFAGGKAMVGAGGGVGNNGPYGPGLGGPAGLRGPIGMMHPQNMMGAGFDPTFMGRGGPYGFHAPVFSGMMPPFQAVNAVGLQGVAPHVNPAFFGHGMSANGAGVMGSNGMEGQMWGDAGMGGGWTGEELGRTRESSFGVDNEASEYGYGKANHQIVGRSNAPWEERGSERDYSGTSERRHHDDRELDWDRSEREQQREEKDGYRDNRTSDRNYDKKVDWNRGQSSSRSRIRSYMQDDDHRSRSRDADYEKDYVKRRRE